jgi:hypothetical protein
MSGCTVYILYLILYFNAITERLRKICALHYSVHHLQSYLSNDGHALPSLHHAVLLLSFNTVSRTRHGTAQVLFI